MTDCYKLILPLKGGMKTSFFIPLVKVKSTLQNKDSSSKVITHLPLNVNGEKNIK